jgi:aromatic ring-opening dioxygenase catalytic subunit (LigB family)
MQESVMSYRMPVVFAPHGGGPWPFVKTRFGTDVEQAGLRDWLAALSAIPRERPKAVLVISAHWEEAGPTVMSGAHPPMLYDYSGFPADAYQIRWPAPGDPALAARVRGLLTAAGFAAGEDANRGFDHGVFVPLKLAYPDADIPTVQLSLIKGLDPAQHIALGKALAPLRDEGVFIVASGLTFHNMRGFGDPQFVAVSKQFDGWLNDIVVMPEAERDARLARWTDAPGARTIHPREEHLLPLMVAAGAAGEDRAAITYNMTYVGVWNSGYVFGG